MSYGSALIYDFDSIIRDIDEFDCKELAAIRRDTLKFLYSIEMELAHRNSCE